MSELALRSFSALCSSLAIGALALLIKKLFSKSAAVSALPFMVLAPFVLRYAYEIRMYSLTMLIAVSATYVLVLAWQKAKLKYWLVYGFLVALGLYTLYMSVLVWAAHAVWLLYMAFKNKNKKNLFHQKFTWGYLLSLVLFLPYIPTVIGQFQNSALSGVASRVTPAQLVTSFSFFSTYQPEWQVSALLTFPLLIFFILIIRSVSYAYRLFNQKEKDYYLLFGFILIIPIFFLAIASFFKPYYLERYLAHIFIFGYAGIGLTLNIIWRKGRHLGALALTSFAVLIFSIGLFKLNQTGNFNFQNLTKPSAKQVRAQIADCQTSTVIADEPFAYIDAEYYYSNCNLKFFNKDELGPYGGYVPLRYSSARIDSTTKLNSLKVYHLHFKDVDNLKLNTDSRYQLTSSKVINEKYYLDEYQLKPSSV
jgi:4-amino-4-deoxy-L-arabinose transferase-like glycosyltransferase